MKQNLSEQQIFIVGLGLDPWLDATIAAIRAIKKANTIFCAPSHQAFVDSLKRPGADISLVNEHLQFDTQRKDCHFLAATRIVESIDKYQCICWVTMGDPTINCGVTNDIVILCQQKEINIEVISGVTSVCSVNANIPFLQLVDSYVQLNAKDLFLTNLNIDTRFPLYVIQIFQHLTTKTIPSLRLREGSLLPTQHRLNQFYPSDHKCYLVCARTQYSQSASHEILLGNLALSSTKVSPETTLVVPSLNRAPHSFVSELAQEWIRPDDEKYLSPLEFLGK